MKKIAFDIHGTIDSNPKGFKLWMQGMIHLGYKVCIISGPPPFQIRKDLLKFGILGDIHYHTIYSVVEWLHQQNVPMHMDSNGNWWASDEDWWNSKGYMCTEFGITDIIDNDIRYAENIPETTRFLYWKDETITNLGMGAKNISPTSQV